MISSHNGLTHHNDIYNTQLNQANHRCIICARPNVKVFHIDGNNQNFDINNLVVLCKYHIEEAELSQHRRGIGADLDTIALTEYQNRQGKSGSTKINVNLENVSGSNINISGGDIHNLNYSASNVDVYQDDFDESTYSHIREANQRFDTKFEYDVFISYSHRDGVWVQDYLVQRLRKLGFKVCLDIDCFDLGAPVIKEIERAVESSKKILLVLSPNYLSSPWTEVENILGSTLDPSGQQRKLLPIMYKKCSLPLRFRGLIYLDISLHNEKSIFEKLIHAIQN